MALAERADSYLWSNLELHNSTLLVWEYDDLGLATRVSDHAATIQSNARVLSIAGGTRKNVDPVAELSSLKHGSIDCAVVSFSAKSLAFTKLLTILHKVHLLLKSGGRLIVRMDALRAGQSPDLRWWDRRNRLAKAAASLAGDSVGAELTADELVAVLQVVGFSLIQPMVFHGEALSPIAMTTLVEEITRYCARMETPNWRQAISEELKLLRQQLETEKGYTAPVAIIDARKQAKQ
ncbi:MAG: hypothetical protein ACM3ZQ_07305 [Bacillota bacterium]